MSEGYEKLMGITEAAGQKSCTRQTIYKAIKAGVLHTAQIGGRTFVVDDESFQGMLIRRTQESPVKKGLDSLENRVEEALGCLKKMDETLQEVLGRLKVIEEKAMKVSDTKVRYREAR